MACPAPARPLLTLAVTVWLTLPLVLGSALPCPPGSSMEWMEDKDDCSKFYLCSEGQRFQFDCGKNVWAQNVRTCVGKGSPLDTCTFRKELNELNSKSCQTSSSAVFEKEDNCAQYYDCSSQEVTVNPDPHVVECPFPKLFNPDSKRCEKYDKVKCGDRPEPKDACEYEANQCRRSSHCVPCHVRFPSCKGLPDGVNPWMGRVVSPFFVFCHQERAIDHGQCDSSKGTQVFDPDERVCVEMKEEERRR